MPKSSAQKDFQIIPSTRSAAIIFGPSVDVYRPLINALVPQVTGAVYQFVDNDEFRAKALTRAYRPGQMNQIYWREIISRAHIAAVASLVRTGRWIEAVIREHDAPNLMGWAACCRCLVEAIGDTADALM
jgi:hypothetical protein